MTEQAETEQIHRRSGLTRREFVETSVRANKAVIFPAPYPCKLDLRRDFSDLIDDVLPRPSVMNPDRTDRLLVRHRLAGGF